MKNKIKNSFIITAVIALFSSCVNDSFNTPVQAVCVSPGLTKTKEVADLYTSAPVNGTTLIYPAAAKDPVTGKEIFDYIEAYVISSDEGGNFYKSMYFQPLDGSKGFNLSVDEVNAYTKTLQPGKKVFLKLNGLAYANPTGFGRGLIFGAPPTEIFAVDRLSGLVYKDYLTPSCDIISEDAIVHKITLSQAFSDTYLNTLVEFDNVQFSDEFAGGTYDANRVDTSDSSILITDGSKNLTIRTSRFANFAGYKVPVGRGKIRGILTKYGSTYQIIMRTERDVNMPNLRVDYSTLIGNALSYSGTLNENFSSYAVALTNFPKYINQAFVGARFWQVKTFSGNQYIEMSSFAGAGNPGVIAKTYFFVPVDFALANTFTFKKEIRYNTGAALKIYYVSDTNYTPGGIVNISNFTNITSSFNITYPAINSSENSFSSPGTYTIPTILTGKGYFVFEYIGSDTITTTVQLDDIIIN